MNKYIIPRSSYDLVNDLSWVCDLPDDSNYNTNFMNLAQRRWWLKYVVPDDSQDLCETSYIKKKASVDNIKNMYSGIRIYTTDILFKNYIINFNVKWNNVLTQFVKNCGTCFIKSYVNPFILRDSTIL